MSEEQITNIKINMAKLEEKLDSSKETSERIERKLDSHIIAEESQLEKYRELFETFFEKADKKYANKKVETIFWAGLGVIGTTLLVWSVNILLTHGK